MLDRGHCCRDAEARDARLGGKSANIVFADAALEKAAAAAPWAVFDNAGQDCCARLRLLVQASVMDQFLSLMQPHVEGFKVGDPLDPTRHGAPDLG